MAAIFLGGGKRIYFREEFTVGSNYVGNFNFFLVHNGYLRVHYMIFKYIFARLKYFVVSFKGHTASCKFAFCFSDPHSV